MLALTIRISTSRCNIQSVTITIEWEFLESRRLVSDDAARQREEEIMPDEKLVTVSELNAVRDQIVEQLLERIEKTETTLLKEFRKWAISFESRFKANEALVVGFSERLVALEERVTDLERAKG